MTQLFLISCILCFQLLIAQENPSTSQETISVESQKTMPENLQADYQKQLDEKIDFHRSFIEKKEEILDKLISTPPSTSLALNTTNNSIQTLWRESAQYIVDSMNHVNFGIDTTNAPSEFEPLIHQEWQKTINNSYTFFRKVNKQRAFYYNQTEKQGLDFYSSKEILAQDFLTELKLIPYRAKAYFLWQKLNFTKNLKSGWSGIYNLAIQVFYLLVFLLMPFLLYVFLKKTKNWLQTYQKKLVNKSYREPSSAKIALVIQKFLPYFTWVFLLISLNIFQSFIEFSPIPELAFILPYFKYYFYYRIFKVFIENSLAFIIRQVEFKERKNVREKLEKTSKIIGISFLVLFSFLHLVYTALGIGLVYQLTEKFLFYFGIIILLYLSQKWKPEITNILLQHKNSFLAQKLKKLCDNSFLSYLFCLPSLIYIFSLRISNFLLNIGQKIEWIKIIYTKILRIRIEGTQKQDNKSNNPLPEDYISAFHTPTTPISVPSQEKAIKTIKNKVTHWINETSKESSLALFGERGIGKTFILNEVAKTPDVKVISISIPPKRLNRKDLFAYFTETLSLNLKSDINNIEISGPEEKTLVVIDNAHNLFLSKIGGFEAYKAFLDIINIRSDNLFWIATFNEQSWTYLESVMGTSQLFRQKIKIGKWSDEDIKRLILQHHDQTDFKLKYDNVLYAASNIDNEIDSAEVRFFRLLWEQCNGNPSVSIEAWLHSVNLTYGKWLKVGLPRDYEVENLTSFHSDLLFVFSSILKHDNLTLRESMLSTNLPEGVVRQALNRGLEAGIIEQIDHQRFRTSMKWFYSLLKFLKSKNYLYSLD